MVRREAVRLQRPMSSGAMPQGNNLRLPCTAYWDTQTWVVRFDQADWIELQFEGTVSVPRPKFSELEEQLNWAIATANDALVPKKIAACSVVRGQPIWVDCVERLRPLHHTVLRSGKDFGPWFQRVWGCVWPTIYREQNVLGGRAELDPIRKEMAACLASVPRLTMWMFVFAKLVCLAQIGRGLGTCSDFRD